jgi:hypothetical protein
MTSLLDLPPELILNIIDQFDTFWRASPDNFDVQDDRTKTLLNLCRTCHYLRHIAQPPLHQVVGVSRHTEAGAFRTLSQLTETVTRRLDLARKTKTLLLKLGGLHKSNGASFLPWKDFASSNRQPVAEDTLFNLVPHLENVTSLELQTDDRKDDLWKAIWSIENHEEQFFPKLQTLSVSRILGPVSHVSIHLITTMEHALTNSRSLVNLADFTSLLTRSTLRTFYSHVSAPRSLVSHVFASHVFTPSLSCIAHLRISPCLRRLPIVHRTSSHLPICIARLRSTPCTPFEDIRWLPLRQTQKWHYSSQSRVFILQID